jgi:hypothetical protein
MSEARCTSLSALAVLLAALLACDVEPSALPYPRLGIVTSDSSGAPVSSDAANVCMLLPVLRGSRIAKSFPIAGSLAVDVTADREGVSVHFKNAAFAVSDKKISRDQLEHGYSEQVSLTDASGASFTLLLSSECQPDAETW